MGGAATPTHFPRVPAAQRTGPPQLMGCGGAGA